MFPHEELAPIGVNYVPLDRHTGDVTPARLRFAEHNEWCYSHVEVSRDTYHRLILGGEYVTTEARFHKGCDKSAGGENVYFTIAQQSLHEMGRHYSHRGREVYLIPRQWARTIDHHLFPQLKDLNERSTH